MLTILVDQRAKKRSNLISIFITLALDKMHLSLLTTFFCSISLTMASLTVKTNLGAINGVQCPSLPVNSYLGIPFVKPPTGDLRYASPAPYNSPYPGGTLNATNFGATCVQFISPDPEPLWPPPNEDWYVATSLNVTFNADGSKACISMSGLHPRQPRGPSCQSRFGYTEVHGLAAAHPILSIAAATWPMTLSWFRSRTVLDHWDGSV